MEIQTSRFGRVNVDEDRIITMKHGLIGFPDQRRFAILRPQPESVLYWYQSVDNPKLAFVITSPFIFIPEYSIILAEGIVAEMKAQSRDELDIYVLVTIPAGHPEKMTANLIGPLIINQKARLAEQLVVEDSPYSHKHPLLGGRKK